MLNIRSLIILLGALAAPFAASSDHEAQRTVVPQRFIVSLKDDADFKTHLTWASAVHTRRSSHYDMAGIGKEFHIGKFNAYAAEFDEVTVEKIRSSPDVLQVEEDQYWTLDDVFISERPEVTALETQKDAPWGLAAVSSRQTGAKDYIYDESAGADTWAYVIDSGILDSHKEFEGRAVLGFNPAGGKSEEDIIGHGTHVAGIIAGKTFGIAKKANVIAIRMFAGENEDTTMTFLSGLEWAVDDIVSKGRQNYSVINISLGNFQSEAVNEAVEAAFQSGVICVCSAGNEGKDASNRSPASAPNAITVAAMAPNRTRADFSNYGSVVNLFAPGVDIISSLSDSDTANMTSSGTSQATPHVAGIVLYLQALEGGIAAENVKDRLSDLAINGVIKDPKDTPNLLLNNGVDTRVSK